MLTSDEDRMLAMCAPILLRMFQAREQRIVTRIYGEFRNGKTDHLAALAEIACIRDLIHEINTALERAQKEKRD